MSDTVSVEFYLVIGTKITSHGTYETHSAPSVAATKRKPSTKQNEVSMLVNLELPMSLFVKPTLSARISVPDSQSAPLVITPEVASDIAAVVRERMGVHLTISSDPAPEPST